MTLIQRFGSALNSNVYFHMLFLDGVYAEDVRGKLRFHRVKASTQEELLHLAHTLSHRFARFLERWGLFEGDAENSYLVFEKQEEDAMQQFFGHSITYRIAIGRHQSRKVFTLQALPPLAESGDSRQAAEVGGFSLHAGVIAEPHRRDKLERLCRYISRPVVSEKPPGTDPKRKDSLPAQDALP